MMMSTSGPSGGRCPSRRRLRGDEGDIKLPVALAAGVAIVLATIIAVKVAALTQPSTDDRPRVLVLGDSITDRGQTELMNEMGASYALSIDGKASYRADMQEPSAKRWATRDFSQVVINLGTNDVDQGWDPNKTAASLARIVALYPEATCIHLVTINEHLPTAASGDPHTLAADINEQIRALAATDPRLRVIDWAGIVDAQLALGINPTADGVHPTSAGYKQLAAAIGDSLDSCAVAS